MRTLCVLERVRLTHSSKPEKKSPLAKPSLGMYDTHIPCTVFELHVCVTTRKKKRQRKKMNKAECFMFDFPKCDKG